MNRPRSLLLSLPTTCVPTLPSFSRASPPFVRSSVAIRHPRSGAPSGTYGQESRREKGRGEQGLLVPVSLSLSLQGWANV